VIDAGTNSIKFHLGERQPDGTWRTVEDRAEVTRLGEGLSETGRISDAALERTVTAIGWMAAEAKRHHVRALAAVGTAGLRIAENGAEAIAAIHQRTGVRLQKISGDEEARLAYCAAVAALGPIAGSTVVFDTGGGSSQFTFGHGGAVDERFSVDVGAARYTERFGLDRAVSDEVVREASAAISNDLARLDGRPAPDALVGMGGAVTNITAVSLGMAEYDPAKVQSAVLTKDEIERQIELYRTRDADARRAIAGLQPKRAEVILAGACIVQAVLAKLGKHSLTVSDRGLRHGILAERFGG
jgi:exopolyphosphatase/guanosine-5'-triphosphate,3'-diphosphate pyrophosphatase